MRGAWGRAALAIAAAIATGAGAAEAAAATPSLSKITARSPGPQLLDVSVKARATRKATGTVRLKLWLSRDTRRGKGDIRVGTLKVSALKARRSRVTRVRLPVSTRAVGRWRVLVCTTATRCRTTSRVTIRRRPATAPPPAATPGPTGPPAAPVGGAATSAAPTVAPAPASSGQQAATPTPPADPGPGTPPPSPPPADPRPSAPPPMTELPAGVTAAVGRLLAAPTLTDEVREARSLLQASGVDAGETSRSAAGFAGLVLPSSIVLQVARDGHNRARSGRVSLDEVATYLQRAGFPGLGAGPDPMLATPGMALRDFLAVATRAAVAAPDDPVLQPVLQLAALAQRQRPAIDLADPTYDPGKLLLGHLDLTLLTAHFGALAAHLRGDDPAPPANAARAGRAAPSSCDNAKEVLETHIPFAGDAWGYATGKIGGAATEAVVRDGVTKLFKQATEAGVQKVLGKALTALGLLSKLQMLQVLYNHAEVEVTPDREEVIKPNPGDDPEPVVFTAVAGVPDAVWAEYQAAHKPDELLSWLKGCAALFGLPTFTDLGDIGAAVSKWRVSWRIDKPGIHALAAAGETYDANPGQLEEYLKPRNDHAGSETWNVDILPARHRLDAGPLTEAEVWVRASVETDSPPNVMTWIGAIEGGFDPSALVGPIGDLAVGMFQNLATLDGWGVVRVHYAVPGNRWSGTVDQAASWQLRTSQTYGPDWNRRRVDERSELHAEVEPGDTPTGWGAIYAHGSGSGRAIDEYSSYSERNDGGYGCPVVRAWSNDHTRTAWRSVGSRRAQARLEADGALLKVFEIPVQADIRSTRDSTYRSRALVTNYRGGCEMRTKTEEDHADSDGGGGRSRFWMDFDGELAGEPQDGGGLRYRGRTERVSTESDGAVHVDRLDIDLMRRGT